MKPFWRFHLQHDDGPTWSRFDRRRNRMSYPTRAYYCYGELEWWNVCIGCIRNDQDFRNDFTLGIPFQYIVGNVIFCIGIRFDIVKYPREDQSAFGVDIRIGRPGSRWNSFHVFVVMPINNNGSSGKCVPSR